MRNNAPKKRNKKQINKETESTLNIINQKILDSILDDDEEKFTEIISQKIISDSFNKQKFSLSNYKLPIILQGNPTYASLCAFFGARRCFNSLLMLLPDGITSNYLKQLDDLKRSPLHFACAGGYLSIVRELEQANFDIDEKDSINMTPSRYAAMMGHLDVIKFLWTKGADVISLCADLWTISTLHEACFYGNLDIVKFIYESVLSDDGYLQTKNIPNRKFFFEQNSMKSESPLHLACEGGHADVVKYLISLTDLFKLQVNAYDVYSRTPIVIACQNGSLSCVQVLMETGEVNFDFKRKKKLPLVEASSNGHLDIVKYLLSQKVVSISEENTKGITSLQASILNKHTKIVQYLVDNGATEKCSDKKIAELFMDACKGLSLQIMKILDKCCKVPFDMICSSKQSDKKITWGDMFMQQACLLENEEIAAFLLSKNCNFDHVDFTANVKNDWSHFMDFLVENGANLNECSNEGSPLIVITIETGNLKRVNKMISMGATLDKNIISNYNCVYVSCIKGKLDLFKFLMKFEPIIHNCIECVKVCISKFVEEQSSNKKKKKNSPFFYMAEQIIVSQKIDLNEKNSKSLISFAASHCCIEMLELFENHGADFANCDLDIADMQSKSYLPIYRFLKEHGCKFDKNGPILDRLFCNSKFNELDSDVFLFLLDFISNDEISEFYNYRGNIVDVLVTKNLTFGLLAIYKKINKAIMPKYMSKAVFFNWIDNVNLPELRKIVYDSIDN